MAFPTKLLNQGEEVVVDLRPHWWFFAGPALALLAALLASAVLAVGDVWDPVRLAMAALAVAALVWFLVRYARWATTNFVVTTDRLVYRSGVLSKSGIEIPLERVNTVFFNQSLFERLLRSGDLGIESAGERGLQRFSDISHPSRVQNEIYRQIEANQSRMSRPHAAPASIPQQLEHLDQLRRRGIIDQAEFDAKKAQLLERM